MAGQGRKDKLTKRTDSKAFKQLKKYTRMKRRNRCFANHICNPFFSYHGLLLISRIIWGCTSQRRERLWHNYPWTQSGNSSTSMNPRNSTRYADQKKQATTQKTKKKKKKKKGVNDIMAQNRCICSKELNINRTDMQETHHSEG